VQFIIIPEKHNIKKPFSLNLGKVLESIWRVLEPHCEQGDQIGRFFLPIGLLMEAHYVFWKDKAAQNNGDFLGYFLFRQIYYIYN
jgi:hypothetical protein